MAEIAKDLFSPRGVLPQSPWLQAGTTSRDAAKAITSRAPTLRDLVLGVLRDAAPAGLTADEVAAKVGKTEFAIRPRLSELNNTGAIMPLPALPGSTVPVKRRNAHGQMAIVWVVKP